MKRCLENRHKYTSAFRSDDLQNILSNKLYISFLSRTLLWDTYRCISDSLGSFYTHKALCFETHLELSTVISSLTDFGKIPISVSSTNLGTKSTNRFIECLNLAGLCQNWSFKIYVVANSLHKLDSTSDSKIKRNCIIVSSNNITVASISLNGLFLKNKFILILKIHIFFCSSFWSKDISYKNSLSYTWIANSFINLFGIYH